MKNKSFTLANSLAIFLGLIFFTAGMGKVVSGHQYPGLIGPVWLIERLAEYQLAFYGTFIAWSQIIIGFLLLTLRFRLLGAVMLVPMILNIWMVTISLQWTGTPWVLTGFFLINLGLLWIDRHRLYPLVNGACGFSNPTQAPETGVGLWFSGLFLVILSVPLSEISLWGCYLLSSTGILLSLLSMRLKNG